jgi:hypothetical protein
MKKESIDKLVNEVLAIEQEEAYQAGAIGYMARALIQATMPHSKVDGHEFKRRNGAFKLTILADSEVGLPYGSIPRLLMSWITTEAVRTKQREIILGKTLSEFMAELEMIPSGGRWGSITRLKDQMKRLFSASISCTYDDGKSWGIRNVMPVERADLWWDPKNPHQATMWESKLLLGDTFFNEVIESPVPIDMRALKVLRQSPMAIDIYCWLTYRMSYLRKITPIPWEVLQVQFGANYKDVRQFKRRFLDQLKKVLFVYPDANVKEGAGTLILLPGKSHIKKQNKSPQLIKVQETESVSKQEEKTAAEAIKIEADLQKKYSEYRLNTVVEIIEGLKNEAERHTLMKDFEKHLARKGLYDIRSKIIQGRHTKPVKEELYNFVNSHWHHILKPLKSYKEFCDTIA